MSKWATQPRASFDVRQFGAVGDGATNDTAAFQAAIDAAASNRPNGQGFGGGIVFVPAGQYVVGQLRMKSRVTVEGVGRHSRLTLKASTNTDMFVLDSLTVGETALRFLTLDGNKANQTGSSSGIRYVGSTDASAQFGANTLGQHDPNHRFLDLYITGFLTDGFYISGRGENHLTNIYCWLNDGRGFNVNCPDSRYTACVAGDNGLDGIQVNSSNNQFIGCKTWYSGRLDYTGANGFSINADRTELAGCEAQDNYGSGFAITSNLNTLAGCTADSNNRLHATTGLDKAGFFFGNNASNNTVIGTAMDRSVSGSPDQAWAISFSGTSTSGITGNRIILTAASHRLARLSPTAQSAVDNDIQIGNANGLHLNTYTASWTPNAYLGGVQRMTLTGDVAISKPIEQHVGQRLALDLIQDATGGRQVTFNSAFITTRPINVTPNSRTEYQFVYDGTNWVDQAAHVHRDALQFGFVTTALNTPTLAVAWGAANDARYVRALSGGTVSSIRLAVTTSSGNISVGVYRRSGNGLAAVPGTQLAAATVACPAVGTADISLGQTVTVEPGDFLAMSCDNTTAAFTGLSGPAGTLFAAQSYQGSSQHPLPSTTPSVTASQFRLPLLLGF